jgi:hypothetical protein
MSVFKSLVGNPNEPENNELEELKKRIEDLSQKVFGKKTVTKAKEEITIPVQILILDYLGVLDNIDLTRERKAMLLALLLKADGVANIKRRLSNKHIGDTKEKSIENLEFVYQVFTDLGLLDEALKVREDLKIFSK